MSAIRNIAPQSEKQKALAAATVRATETAPPRHTT